MNKIEVRAEPAELYKILKFEGLAGSGGEAKARIAAGEVTLNGDVELQKRKKVHAGDTIAIDATEYLVVVASTEQDHAESPEPSLDA